MEAVRRNWGIDATDGPRLHGGEESSAYRLTDYVVRIGPEWRCDAELEWAHRVAAHASKSVPEAIAPVFTDSGVSVVRVEGRPISLWPFRPGSWPGDDDNFEDQAADLLARVHRALKDVRMPSRPGPGPTFAEAPELQDPELDEWLQNFDQTFPSRQPLHGDFYGGNTLVDEGRFVGLLDWDEAFIGPPERELAWGAWEWGDGLYSQDLSDAMEFLDEYVAVGGVASRIDEVTLRQLVRQRFRQEVRYARAARMRGVEHDEDDFDYERRQLEAFRELRP